MASVKPPSEQLDGRYSPPIHLAKWRMESRDGVEGWAYPRGYTFKDHSNEVVKMTKRLMAPKFIGYQLYKAMRLKRYITWKAFRLVLFLAALLHDMGKDAQDFLKMLWSLEDAYQKALREGITEIKVLKKRLRAARYKQRYRHEALSGWLITYYRTKAADGQPQRPLWEWLVKQAGSERNAKVVLFAVIGHHRKTDRDISKDTVDMLANNPSPRELSVDVQATHLISELNDVIRKEGLLNGRGQPLDPLPAITKQADGIMRCRLTDLQGRFNELIKPWSTELETPLTFAVKVLLMTADWWGSMNPGPEFTGSDDHYRDCIIKAFRKALGDLEPTNLRCHPATAKAISQLFPTQKKALKATGSVANLGAPGDGKTASNLLGLADPKTLLLHKRALYAVPLANLAAQLRLDVGSKKDRVRTSRSYLDQILWATAEDEDEEGQEEQDWLDGLRYLGNYQAPITFCTIDQLLGVLAYSRAGILLLPYILISNLVFDECHAYDSRLWAYFQRFLEWFPDLDCSVASATLPKTRIAEIQKFRPNITIIRNTKNDLSSYKRYVFSDCNVSAFLSRFEAVTRTLLYTNTVRSAQDIGRRFTDSLVHHARRQYEQRVAQHMRVVEAFRSGGPVRCVSTQIAEIGFDIMAGQLLNEACPIADFLQRLGRATPRGMVPSRITRVYLCDTGNILPYSVADMNGAADFYQKICNGKEWSQQELATLFHKMFPGQSVVSQIHPACTTSRFPLRDADCMTTAILASDLPAAKLAYKKEWNAGLQRYEFNLGYYHVKDKDYDRYHYRYIVPYQEDPRLGILIPAKTDTPFK